MKPYEEVLKTVELALSRGEYTLCIGVLSPIIEEYPLSSEEGVNLRTILITAFCGINEKDKAKKYCKELLKSYNYKTRENAKYLMEIIDSPEIKKPENWNINFESNTSLKKKDLNLPNLKKNSKNEKKFINIIDSPTGETKPFKVGFTFIISLILLLLIALLSGCVRIENTLNLSELDSINNYLKVESKYVSKFPWQIKFEDKLKDMFPNSEILIEESNFSLKNKNLSMKDAKKILKDIQLAAGELAGGSTNLEINTNEKNFIFLKKNNYKLDLDLQAISNIDNLELIFKIISPNKVTLSTVDNNKQFKISKNIIAWNLIPGQINSLEFSFWSWNKLLISTTSVLIILILAYSLRFYRYKIGTDFPQLPS